jgi:pSer/pThr/pTyr-binding forkhead associated (FHA) protein
MVGEYGPGNRDEVSVTSEVTTAMPQVPSQDGRPAPQRPQFKPVLPPGVALLVVTHGPNAGARFLLDLDVITAGRSVDSDIFLDDVTVSRQHAEFRRTPTGDGFAIIDLGSLNGTYVNGERVDEARLRGGDTVQIGRFHLVLRTAEAI